MIRMCSGLLRHDSDTSGRKTVPDPELDKFLRPMRDHVWFCLELVRNVCVCVCVCVNREQFISRLEPSFFW